MTTLVLGVSAAVVASVIAAVASLTGALVTAILGQRIKRRNDERLEHLRDELAEGQAERDAMRDYRYDAIKRLYTDLQPLVFQLNELCESAYLHARGLARTARSGNLGAGEHSWLRDEYFLRSTAHRFLLPVAVLRLMQLRLTAVDLSVDPSLRAQYGFARTLAATWVAGFDVAGQEPALQYRPHDDDASARAKDKPAVYTLQHLYAGQVDQIAACLIGKDLAGQLTVRRYSEFAAAYQDERSTQEAFAPALNLFATFHPRTHPVLWRILIVQAHLYRALAATFADTEGTVLSPAEALPQAERSLFDWREPGAGESDEEAVAAPFRAAEAYLRSERPVH